MRWLFFIVILLFLVYNIACSLRKVLPSKSVLSAKERAALFTQIRASNAEYLEPARISIPPLPFQVFGLSYDLDLVVVIEHPKWNMHEFARVKSPEGDIWLVKEADHSGLQTIISDTPALFSLAPEVDVPRLQQRISVENQSDEKNLDLSFSYQNRDGKPTRLHFQGPRPTKVPQSRNGNTMGHSRQTLLAVLDLSRQAQAKKVNLSIDGKSYSIKKILGVQPFAFSLEQTQAGLSAAKFTQTPNNTGFLLQRKEIEENWTISEENDRLIVKRDGLTTLLYTFQKNQDSWEFISAEVRQFGYETPTLRLLVNPALPDLRRPFSGLYQSHFVIDVNGQKNHSTGVVTVSGTDDGALIEFLPEKPFWAKERPFQTLIRLTQEQISIDSQRKFLPE